MVSACQGAQCPCHRLCDGLAELTRPEPWRSAAMPRRHERSYFDLEQLRQWPLRQLTLATRQDKEHILGRSTLLFGLTNSHLFGFTSVKPAVHGAARHSCRPGSSIPDTAGRSLRHDGTRAPLQQQQRSLCCSLLLASLCQHLAAMPWVNAGISRRRRRRLYGGAARQSLRQRPPHWIPPEHCSCHPPPRRPRQRLASARRRSSRSLAVAPP